MDNTDHLQNQIIACGDPDALGQLMLKYQDRLERIICFRMDRKLRSRIDAADVVQEAFVEATQRIDDYVRCSDNRPARAG